jgi:hypothetical protein
VKWRGNRAVPLVAKTELDVVPLLGALLLPPVVEPHLKRLADGSLTISTDDTSLVLLLQPEDLKSVSLSLQKSFEAVAGLVGGGGGEAAMRTRSARADMGRAGEETHRLVESSGGCIGVV